jgi:hypothetical protein
MTETGTPKRGAHAAAEASSRQARAAEALRANLRRRKAQARAREDLGSVPADAPQDPPIVAAPLSDPPPRG